MNELTKNAQQIIKPLEEIKQLTAPLKSNTPVGFTNLALNKSDFSPVLKEQMEIYSRICSPIKAHGFSLPDDRLSRTILDIQRQLSSFVGKSATNSLNPVGSIKGVQSAVGLLSSFQKIKVYDNYVAIPKELISDDDHIDNLISEEEIETSSTNSIKKISFNQATRYIEIFIQILFALISILQDNSPLIDNSITYQNNINIHIQSKEDSTQALGTAEKTNEYLISIFGQLCSKEQECEACLPEFQALDSDSSRSE